MSQIQPAQQEQHQAVTSRVAKTTTAVTPRSCTRCHYHFHDPGRVVRCYRVWCYCYFCFLLDAHRYTTGKHGNRADKMSVKIGWPCGQDMGRRLSSWDIRPSNKLRVLLETLPILFISLPSLVGTSSSASSFIVMSIHIPLDSEYQSQHQFNCDIRVKEQSENR
ncbi:hypothetical protein HAX54_051192 [Datura stramonium]|uniref:Uncharacterized protein n=1 Tax=Datura stramonium TaxID=4076 RepID=A0ABS8WM52_DATST|nr:hypothetical protein [Datura stramonium]